MIDPIEQHLTERNRKDTLARAGIGTHSDPLEIMTRALRLIRDFQPKGYRAAAIARRALAEVEK